ncbi:hypothetical protein BANRA_04353 [Klebsiella quasipneumoniae]|nr:hypothetical protein BANRA_04353 [Klebsiella quasipneumoniae]
MSLPFKPHIIALLCSAGLLAAAGTLYVQSRTPEMVTQPTAQPAPAPAPTPTPAAPAAAQPVAATYTQAQIDQWVAPIALYPDSLLSQVLMASTYPDNVMQAVQWSQDNPTMKGGSRRSGCCQPAVGSQRQIACRFPCPAGDDGRESALGGKSG